MGCNLTSSAVINAPTYARTTVKPLSCSCDKISLLITNTSMADKAPRLFTSTATLT